MAATAPELRSLFTYDEGSGLLLNRIHRGTTARAGSEAGFKNGNGYRRVRVFGKQIYTHQIIWIMHYGALPPGEIDHIDGDPCNNRLENLRACDHASNTRNSAPRSHSRNPYKGVRRDPRTQKWTARIVHDKQAYYLGAYEAPEAAHAAYASAASRLHGEFARTG